MHASPFAAPAPDGDAMAAHATRVCVHGARPVAADRLAALRARVPAQARCALFGACADAAAWPDAELVADMPDADDAHAVLRAAAARWPGDPLVLVRADADLPAFACERLLRALESPGVLAALPLGHGSRSPLQPGMSTADTRIDRLCFAYSDCTIIDDPGSLAHAWPACSAWDGARLARVGADAATRRDRIDAAGLRVVVLDHLHVVDPAAAPTAPREDPRDPLPPSPLDALRARVANALAEGAQPGCAGLDQRPVLLHVLHGWGGGAERWVRDFAAADRQAHHLVLVARGSFARRRHGEWLELHDGTLAGPALARWPLPRPIAETALADHAYSMLLAHVVRRHCVDAVIVSSLIGHSLDALRTGLPTTCVVHDHYPLWPVLHRDFGDARLAFDEAQLAADLAAMDAGAEFAERDPACWRQLRDAFVATLRATNATLVAPSRSALANHLRLAPELAALDADVIAHGLAAWPRQATLPAPPARERLRLVVTGRIRKGKGAELIAAVLPTLREHAEIFLLGAGADAQELFGQSGVHVLLDYRRDELPELLARIAPDAALLLPTVAETFSYTLSELRSLGLPVIATRVGALAERIEDGVDGLLVEPDAAAIVARVRALAADRGTLARLRVAHAGAGTQAMASAWHARLRLGTRPALRYPLAEAGRELLEAAIEADASRRAGERECALVARLDAVSSESERRGDWGHALDRELAALRTEFDERTRWALALNSELQQIKPIHEQMLASTSWRITAPLRDANARLRGVRASLAFRGARVRALAGRLRGSLAQRGLAGTLARIAQEMRGRPAARSRTVYVDPVDDATPFEVPTSTTPRVSIVIPVYGKVAYTLACLRSIARHAGPIPFEVIVVDDGSPDATPQRLAAIGGIRTLRNERNLGFIGSCNAGAAQARGEFVLFLNNDTVVTAGWLEALARCLEQAPAAGLVGAKLVYPDGRLQEAGGIVFDDGSGWNYGRFEDPDDPRFAFRRTADYCSGAAIMLRRDLFERLGRFDARYAPAYYEDTDLAFAVRAAGLEVYVEPAATVVHFEGITSGTDTSAGIKRHQVVNRDTFVAKWKDALARQPRPGTPIHLAATHRARRRVLIVDATTPTPDQDSGSLRMVNLMRVLADLGCQTSFLPENRLFVERYTPALQALGVEALYAPAVQDPVRLLRDRGREFDLVLLSRHYVAAGLVGLVRLYAPQATLAFDTVDLHYLREQRAAELSGDAAMARHAATTRAQELKLIRECDVTLVVSPVEQELLARDAPGSRVEVLSNVHEVHGCKAGFDARRDLVFVGGFQHPPNADAVEWFVAEVLPLVRRELPDVRLHVIGSKVPDAIRSLADASVVVHGFVEDILPFMDGCRVSVAPLRYGAGVKGKVNMAMSCGLPVVATPIAVEGMHVREGADVLVAADAVAFAAAVVQLYRDEALWNTLSANGLANVEQHFSFDAARAAVSRLLDTERHRGQPRAP